MLPIHVYEKNNDLKKKKFQINRCVKDTSTH